MRTTSRFMLFPVIAFTMGACADSPTESTTSVAPPSLSVVGEPGFVLLKKVGPLSSYTFSLSISEGLFSNGNPVTVSADSWTRIWEATSSAAGNDNLVVQEVLAPTMKVDSAYITPLVRLADGTLGELDNFKQVIIGTNQFEVPNVGWDRGAYVIVWNSAGRGAGGCTPGYWKQPHHYDSWVRYSPTQQFSSVFANAFRGMTLAQVAAQGGGGLKALGRHTVAALLNSTNSAVGFPLSTAQVIAQFNAAYSTGAYEGMKNQFASLNERNCYLN